MLIANVLLLNIHMFMSISGVSNEDLEDIIARLNSNIDGMSTSEKEDHAIELITNTRARVMPGVRFLPRTYYSEEEKAPSSVNTGENDQDGLPILNSEDEVKAFVRHTNRGPRNPSDVKLPSTSNKLPEAKTDSEYSPKKKRANEGTDEGHEEKRQRTEVSNMNIWYNVCMLIIMYVFLFSPHHSTLSLTARNLHNSQVSIMVILGAKAQPRIFPPRLLQPILLPHRSMSREM